MTVQNQTQKVTANGNDSATVFSFSPIVLPDETAQLEVTKVDADNVETLLVEGTGATNYSVSVSSFPGTGSVTYPATGATRLATGEKLVMKRVLTLEQQTDLENQGGYFAETQETQFDRLVMIDLQQQEEIDRALKKTISDSAGSFKPMPSKAELANKLLGFDDAGDPIPVNGADGSSTAVTANGSTSSRLLAVRFGEIVNLRDFGATGDGLTDDTAAIQAALDAIPSTGRRAAYMPPGTYRLTGSLSLANKAGVTLYGRGAASTFLVTGNNRLLAATDCNQFMATDFRVLGDLDQDADVATVLNKGQLWFGDVDDADVLGCIFEAVSACVFWSNVTNRIRIAENRMLDVHAPIQQGSLAQGEAQIRGNFIRGQIFPGINTWSDDLIAVFSGPSGKIDISHNHLNKQGPGDKIMSRCINVAADSGGTTLNSEINVGNNQCYNARCTDEAIGAASDTIVIAGINASFATRNVNCHDNIIKVCNGGIAIEGFAEQINIHDNLIEDADKPANPSGVSAQGTGIRQFSGSANAVKRLGIHHNIMRDLEGRGIDFAQVLNKVGVNFNLIEVCEKVVLQGTDLDVIGNQVYGTTATGNNGGIQITNSDRVKFIGNTVRDGAAFGLFLSGTNWTSGVLADNDLGNNTGGTLQDFRTNPGRGTIKRGNIQIGDTALNGGVGGVFSVNYRGQAVLSSGTVAVTFGNPEPDTNYDIFVQAPSNEYFWITSKATTGFTINSSVGASTSTVNWFLFRR